MRPAAPAPRTALRTAPRTAIVAVCLALAACGGSGGTAPGAVSEGEARALEQAAEMLDEQRLPEGALPDIDAPIAEQAPDAVREAPPEMTGDSTE